MAVVCECAMATAISLNKKMSDQTIRERTTTVCGAPVTVFSFDGEHWFSDERQAERFQKHYAKLMAELSKSIQHSATFKHADRPIGKRARRRIESEKKIATTEQR